MRKKILVVDDDAELVELLCFNLKQAGFATVSASNGVDALKKAGSLAPDLILLDLMLPELNGFGVCETLRRTPATAAIPIIMVTAVSGEMGRMAGLDCGANDYITKPFSPRELISRVEKLLHRQPEPPQLRSHAPAPDS